MSEAILSDVLAGAGLTVIGTFEFRAPHSWSPESLAGFAQPISILSRSALDEHLEAFARDLQGRLLAVRPDGHSDDGVSFTHDLAVMP